ncbi:MFS transporter [Halopiger goleimassiliensis]|uniref:MFS transporter n=1 Tax=Halopiger goleimassiliensis TaxID=1293048 RepID=UPI000677B51F|nr:MFS transporter [Halopiger goleimassiliensis]
MNRNDRQIVGFTTIGHAMFHLYELAIPLFIVVWLPAFDTSPAVLGTLVGVGLALIGLGAVVSGVLADEYGSKTLVTVSILGMGSSFVLLSAAPTLEVLAVGLLVWGAASSLYHPAALSLLTRGAAERGTALAYHGAAGNVGTALGPFAAAILLTGLPWRTVAAVLALPAVVAVALAFRFEFDETAGTDGGTASPATETGLTGVVGFFRQSRALFTAGFVVVFLLVMTHGLYARGVLSFLPEILSDLPLFDPVAIGGESFEPSQYVYAGLLLLGGIGQYVGGKWTDRTRTEYALIGTYSVVVLASLAFVPAARTGLWAILAVCAVLGITIYMSAPIRQALLAEYSPPDVHGLSFGYFYLGVYGVGAVGASLAGIVLTYGTQTTFFLAFAGIAAVAVALGGLLLVRFSSYRFD